LLNAIETYTLFFYLPLKIMVFVHCHWFINFVCYAPLPLLLHLSRAHA
jgi:hypothetical protein